MDPQLQIAWRQATTENALSNIGLALLLSILALVVLGAPQVSPARPQPEIPAAPSPAQRPPVVVARPVPVPHRRPTAPPPPPPDPRIDFGGPNEVGLSTQGRVWGEVPSLSPPAPLPRRRRASRPNRYLSASTPRPIAEPVPEVISTPAPETSEDPTGGLPFGAEDGGVAVNTSASSLFRGFGEPEPPTDAKPQAAPSSPPPTNEFAGGTADEQILSEAPPPKPVGDQVVSSLTESIKTILVMKAVEKR